MNNKQEMTYPLGTRPGDGEALEVCDGVLWVRMPIPFKGLDYINLYLIEDDDGWTMVDSGYNSEEIKTLWVQIFDKYLKGKPVTRLICTHFHPDHMGLAGWVCEYWSIQLTMTFGEWTFGRMLYLESGGEVPDHLIEFNKKVGFTENMLNMVRKGGFSFFKNAVHNLPPSFIRIEDGQEISISGNSWRVIVGKGHSQEHACLYCEDKGVLISGDQVLPRITPHIGVYVSEPSANPLEKFLNSIDKLSSLPEETLVLPAHNDVFIGLHNQLIYYREHHAERLLRLKNACGSPKTAFDLLPILFERELSENNQRLAVAEGLAHCHYLVGTGELERITGADGVWRFQIAQNVKTAVA
ncbi:MBL fold metallo-hydrolase [Sneathiella glossodoripedis]|uniref:MBL fold metallo-hydrolase n=1 Tax=Sneathiella glossodoripedis TaxID=418853 RepID=UPI0004712E31|nr:MBL fold metallo-hydrolase [Sneathiella glossodoripedis]